MKKLVRQMIGQEPPSERQAHAMRLAAQDYEVIAALVGKRIALGLSQTDVAEMLGVTQQAISKFEQMDSDPRLSTIRRYALAVEAEIEHRVCG